MDRYDPKDALSPFYVRSGLNNYVQCYRNNITLHIPDRADVDLRCPFNPLIIPVETSFTLDSMQHRYTKETVEMVGEKEINFNATMSLVEQPLWEGLQKKIQRNLLDLNDNLVMMENAKITSAEADFLKAWYQLSFLERLTIGLVIIAALVCVVLFLKKDPLLEMMRLHLMSNMFNRGATQDAQSNLPTRAVSLVSLDSIKSHASAMRPPTPYNHVKFADADSLASARL